MALSSREEFERAVQTRAAPRVYSGSAARLELRWDGGIPNTIDAIKALWESGLSLADAKAKIEAMLVDRVLVVDLPFVPDLDALVARFEADVVPTRVLSTAAADVPA